MRVDQSHLAAVAFLCVERSGGAITHPEPKATVFFVLAPVPGQPTTGALWAVTGRHCIQEARATGRNVSVRVNSPDGVRDIPTEPDDWHESIEADVACCLWKDERPVESAIPIVQLVDENYRYRFGQLAPGRVYPMNEEPIYVGAETVFVGLFSEAAGKERNLPIARFGNVSRLPSESIAVQRADTVEHIEGYLIEARSWGGHSGSPVFWTHPITHVEQVSVPGGRNREARRRGPAPTIPISHQNHMFAMLGLVSAHYDIEREGNAKGEKKATIVTRLNSGMAVVTPAHFIRRLIESAPVEEQVKAVAEEVASNFEPTATMDFIHEEPDEPRELPEEFENFEELTRQAAVGIGGHQYHLGTFDDIDVAARVASEFRAKHVPFSQDALK